MRRAIAIGLSVTFAVAAGPALAQTPSEGGYSSTPIVVPPGPTDTDTDAGEVAGATATVVGASTGGNQGVAGTSAGAAGLPAAAVTPTESVDSGSLPFTGLDLGLMVVLAAGLLGLGVALRRASAQPDA